MQHVHNLLPDYIAGKLESSLRREVSAHLDECPACRAESELIAEALAAAAETGRLSPPHGYFGTVLPRVRQRVERSDRFAWTRNPLFARVAAPLAAVLVVVSLLSQIPFGQGTISDQFASDTITPSDVADELALQPEFLPLADVEQLAATTLADGVLEEQLAEFFTGEGYGIEFEEYPGASTDLWLNSLSDQEVEQLLERLAERKL